MRNLTILLVLITALFSGTAFAANQTNTSGLTAEQRAVIEAQIAGLKADNLTNKTKGVINAVAEMSEQDVERYAKIGTIVASTIKETAKGLGMAVDEFVGTSTGTLVMFLIVYHFFGAELVTFGVGFFFMMPLTFWLSRKFIRAARTKSITYTDDGKPKEVLYEAMDSDQTAAVGWIYGLTMVAVIIQVFIYLP